ncbi:ANTAR domain-containing protein [Streptomyces asiaticus]|uniref:ANTAR domain-containing protein n=1 Tax=Streptomyces asiaticus TaxID=114695 RepID=UPI003F667CE6
MILQGLLRASFGCTAEDAWEILVEVSQNSNVKLRTVAEQVMTAVTGQEPAEAVRWRDRLPELAAGPSMATRPGQCSHDHRAERRQPRTSGAGRRPRAGEEERRHP